MCWEIIFWLSIGCNRELIRLSILANINDVRVLQRHHQLSYSMHRHLRHRRTLALERSEEDHYSWGHDLKRFRAAGLVCQSSHFTYSLFAVCIIIWQIYHLNLVLNFVGGGQKCRFVNYTNANQVCWSDLLMLDSD